MAIDQVTNYTVLLPLIVAVIGTILGFYYFNRTNKSDRDALARQKNRDEVDLAKELQIDTEKVAVDVKNSMNEHFANLLDKIRSDIELQRTLLVSELNLMKRDDKDLRNDLASSIKAQQEVNERMEKSLNFVSQFLWGQGAKSIPPYLQGMEETQEHKDEIPEGIYMHPDSTETQAMKDAKQGGSTKSEEIKDNRQDEKERQEDKGEAADTTNKTKTEDEK